MLYNDYISVLGFILYHAVVFVFLMTFQYLFSKTFKKAADKAYQQIFKSILYGMTFLIAIPLISLLLLATLFGIPVGLMLLFVYVILVLLLIFIIPVLVANLVNRYGHFKLGLCPLSMLSLVVLWTIILSFRISVIGWCVLGILSCLCLGSLLNIINWRRISDAFMNFLNLTKRG